MFIHVSFPFNRAVDVVTPLMTQVTYEGMIDEILGIKTNVVYVNVTDRTGATEKKKYILNSADPMHSEMRDVPWHKAAPRIRDWVQKMKHDWQSIKQDTSSKSVSEMREFANRSHYTIAQRIYLSRSSVWQTDATGFYRNAFKHQRTDC